MTDDLAEAKRHIAWLRNQLCRPLNYGDTGGPLETCDVCETVASEPGKPARHADHCHIPAIDKFIGDAEGQTVEGGANRAQRAIRLVEIRQRAGEHKALDGFNDLANYCRVVEADRDWLLDEIVRTDKATLSTTDEFSQIISAGDEEQRMLQAELTRLKAAQPEHDRTVRLAVLEAAAALCERIIMGDKSTWDEKFRHGFNTALKTAASGIRSLKDQTGGEGGI